EPVHLVALTQIRRKRLALRRDLREVRGAGVMDHGRAAEKATDRTRDDVVDRGRALTASGHENDQILGRYPELRAPRLPGPCEERAADRIAVDERATTREHAQRRLEGRADPLRPSGEQAVHAAGDGVALPDVDGHARDPRGERRRQRRDAAGRAADVGFELQDLEERVNAGDRQKRRARDEREARVRIAQGWHHGRVEGDPGAGHELSLVAATTTDEEERRVGIRFAERFRDREERAHVSARPATDEKHATGSSAAWFGLGQRSGGYPRR